jgi:hypothetical protein
MEKGFQPSSVRSLLPFPFPSVSLPFPLGCLRHGRWGSSAWLFLFFCPMEGILEAHVIFAHVFLGTTTWHNGPGFVVENLTTRYPPLETIYDADG